MWLICELATQLGLALYLGYTFAQIAESVVCTLFVNIANPNHCIHQLLSQPGQSVDPGQMPYLHFSNLCVSQTCMRIFY